MDNFTLLKIKSVIKLQQFCLGLLLGSLLLTSCMKDDFDKFSKTQTNWHPEFTTPILDSKLTLKDIIKDTTGLLHEDSTGFLTIVYESELFSQSAENAMPVLNQTFPEIKEEFNISNPGSTLAIQDTMFYYPFQTPKRQRLDSMFIKSGKINFDISTTGITQDINIVITIPNIVKNGSALELNLQLGAQEIYAFDLTGYKITFDNSYPNQMNRLQVVYAVEVSNPNFEPVIGTVNFNGSLDNIKFSKMFGYLQQYDLALPGDSIFNLGFFKNNQFGNLNFPDLNLGFTIDNSYGLPIQINVNKFASHSDVTAPYNVNFFYENPYHININSPSLAHIGESVPTALNLNKDNTNIWDALNISPTKITYKMAGITNPLNDSTVTNFVLDTSRFKVKVKVELPLNGSISRLVLQDTLNFEFPDVDMLESIKFFVKTINGFPITAKIQAYFCDAAYQRLDSLMGTDQNVIMGGTINPATHEVTAPTTKTTVVELLKNRVDHLKNTKMIIVRGELSTTNGQVGKIYSSQSLSIKLATAAKLRANF